MKTSKHIFLIVLIFNIFQNRSFSQNIDSLKLVLKSVKNDTIKCNVLSILSETAEDNEWPAFNDELKSVCEKNLKNKNLSAKMKFFYLKHLAISLNNIGYLSEDEGNIDKALEYYKKSLVIKEQINDKEGLSASLNNIGLIYKNQGDIPKALGYYLRNLNVQEEINDKRGIGLSLNNIGVIYAHQNDDEKALEYYNKSLKVRQEIDDKKGIAYSLINISAIYSKQKQYLKANIFLKKSLVILKEIHDLKGYATCLNNIGLVCEYLSEQNNSQITQKQKDSLVKQASENYNQSFKLFQQIDDKRGMSYSLNSLAFTNFKKGNFNEAKQYAEHGFKLSKEIGFPEITSRASEMLSKIYSKIGNYKGAYEMQVLYKQMSDSITNETNKKASIQKSLQFEYDKKTTADSIKVAGERQIFEINMQNEKTQRFALYGGLFLVIVFAGFMFNRFKVTQNQKLLIEIKEKETQSQNIIITQQKHLVEEKHKEISDSINYAERIQRSFLATKELLDENLKDYFVFFKPKDVVSGDFYWAHQLNNNNFILVTADSTGHGVPGAIMSLLNTSSLERSVELGITEPAKILNHTRQTIIERLKKDGSSEGGKDGMDCSLICLNKDKTKLVYAAANNPIWIVRFVSSMEVSVSRAEDVELIELVPDKIPVGKHDRDMVSFTQYEIDLQKGDMIYTLTDGYPDQFGGPKGKKFMYKKLKEMLLSISRLPVKEQQDFLKNSLNDWMRNSEQVDDITIIGIRV